MHNAAALVDTPRGQSGRPSKALTADQAGAVLRAARTSRLGAYVVLCLLTGVRTEEARALRWDHVDLDAGSIAVWRSVRLGGDTKTAKSRRTLGLPRRSLRHCASTAYGKTRTGWPPGNSGGRKVSSSPPRSARHWTRRMSGGPSSPSARLQALKTAGHPASCAQASSASCRPRACRWRRSHAWWATRVHGQRKSYTGGSSGRCWSRAPR
jgi:integrase